MACCPSSRTWWSPVCSERLKMDRLPCRSSRRMSTTSTGGNSSDNASSLTGWYRRFKPCEGKGIASSAFGFPSSLRAARSGRALATAESEAFLDYKVKDKVAVEFHRYFEKHKKFGRDYLFFFFVAFFFVAFFLVFLLAAIFLLPRIIAKTWRS